MYFLTLPRPLHSFKLVLLILPLAGFGSVFAAGSSGKRQAPHPSATASEANTKLVAIDEVQALVDSARYDEAIQKGRELIKHDRSAAAFTLMGFALRRQGKWMESVSAYTEALHIDPNYAQAKEYLGVAYLELGQEKRARDLYNDLQKSNTNLADMLKSEAKKKGHSW